MKLLAALSAFICFSPPDWHIVEQVKYLICLAAVETMDHARIHFKWEIPAQESICQAELKKLTFFAPAENLRDHIVRNFERRVMRGREDLVLKRLAHLSQWLMNILMSRRRQGRNQSRDGWALELMRSHSHRPVTPACRNLRRGP